MSRENKKLTTENRELAKKCRDLQDRLTEVENLQSALQIQESEKDNYIEVLREELKCRNQELKDLEEKNKKLTQECQLLTVRMLEEKSKMIEVMNEANSVYEGSMRRSLTADPNMANEFNARTSLFMQSNTDLSEIIKPEYIDGANQNEVIENLPQDVKIKMVAHSDACTALAFSPLGDTLVTGGADKCVRLWNVKKMNEVACLRNKTHSICATAFSLDNSLLMSCSTDHRATLYNLRGNIKTQTSFTAHQDLITSTKFCFSTK